MDPNTHSTPPPPGPLDDDLAALKVAAARLAARDLDRLPDAAVADQVLALRRLLDGLEGHWLKELAGVDGRGAAGADQDQQLGSTAAWLRSRLGMAANTAARSARTARALFRGPSPAPATPSGPGSCRPPAHAQVLATAPSPSPTTSPARPNRSCSRRPEGWTRAGSATPSTTWCRWPTRRRRPSPGAPPSAAGAVAGSELGPPGRRRRTPGAGGRPDGPGRPGAVGSPSAAGDVRSGSQRTADALTELARRSLEAGRLPTTGGVRPQLAVVVDLASLLGQPRGLVGN